MTPASFLRELHRRDRALSAAGWLMAAGLVAAVGLSLVDTRTILGINPWIKPMKFFASLTFFLWTMAWFMPETEARLATRLAVARWTFIGAMVGEIVLIVLQAARGTTSHFNHATPLDAAIFNAMGFMIVANTIAVALFARSLRPATDHTRAGYLLGIRLGLWVFIAGSLIGFVMVSNNSHAVPGPDGGPGLPFVNWSTTMGDVRIAHFIGLHALQVLPLVGFVTDRVRPAATSRRLVSALGVLWTGVVAAALWLALAGVPLWWN